VAKRPANRTVRPNATASTHVDPLSDLFTSMRVRGAIHCRLEATAPWGVTFPRSANAKFGLVTRGSCWLSVTGERATPLRAGDCYIVAPDVAITLRDAPRSRVVDGVGLFGSSGDGVVACGGGGVPTHIVSGLFELDEWSATPLFRLLPRLLCVRTDDTEADMVRATLDLLARETARAALGTTVVSSRLADIMFVQMIRAYLASESAGELGWLRALGHPQLGLALRAMHHEPARAWSVEELAVVAGMSRSAFASHFKTWLGEPPLEYLTRWRMFRAGQLLREGTLGLAEIAGIVGYDSAGALSRAFARVYVQSPREFRLAAR
jgi:AraC-like DNA-binding protein